MSFSKESAVTHAKRDLAKRLKTDVSDIREISVSERDFPDMSLGAPVAGEMSAQMISSGWEIRLGSGGKTFDYRADEYQLRLHNFNGQNYVIDK